MTATLLSANGRYGASRAVPATKAGRPLSVQSRELRGNAEQLETRRERAAAVAHLAVDFLANVVPNHERVHPVRPKLSSRQGDNRLLHLRFAIIIALGNGRPCRGQ